MESVGKEQREQEMSVGEEGMEKEIQLLVGKIFQTSCEEIISRSRRQLQKPNPAS
jgi:hypothetical protein